MKEKQLWSFRMSGSKMEEIGWRESIENCRTWNAQMSHRRRARLPYHDASTDCYQNKCNLYTFHDSERRVGKGTCALWYAPKRWVKTGTKGQMMDDPLMELKLMEESYQQEINSRALLSQNVDLYATLEGEIGPESDEEYTAGRKRSRKSRASKGGIGIGSSRKTRKSRAKNISMDDDYDQVEAEHFCGLCGKSFMQKSTLSHHIKNDHQTAIPHGSIIPQDKMVPPNGYPPMLPSMRAPMGHPHGLPPPPPLQKMAPINPMQKCVLCSHAVQPGRLGLDIMLVCTDCKKSHHPQCMEIKPQMIPHIRKYNWQCTDCKSCNKCGKSENDESILFCDQCDRGFHLYCLTPPLSTAPQGSWNCRHCN